MVNMNLIDAAFYGDLSEVKHLLASEAEVNTTNERGITPLEGHNPINGCLTKRVPGSRGVTPCQWG